MYMVYTVELAGGNDGSRENPQSGNNLVITVSREEADALNLHEGGDILKLGVAACLGQCGPLLHKMGQEVLL